MNRFYFQLLFCLLLTGCLIRKDSPNTQDATPIHDVLLDKVVLFDSSRNREVPVTYYTPKRDRKIKKQQIVIFSHGYGQNKGGDNLAYSYLTENLASKGYFVASVQHELPTDELLAMDGNFQITRRPNWDRGVENIYFILRELKKTKPELDFQHLILIGHSNGADMTVLFAHLYPHLVYKVIALDNRRMPLPLVAKPKIYTLRSNDYPADEGVLPTAAQQKEYGITVQFTPVNHSNMDNDASKAERQIINSFIVQYIMGK